MGSEFSRLRRFTEMPCLAGQTRTTSKLNRYADVLPYDANRVRLKSSPTGYINASHLQSRPDEEPAWSYIATQVKHPYSRIVKLVSLSALPLNTGMLSFVVDPHCRRSFFQQHTWLSMLMQQFGHDVPIDRGIRSYTKRLTIILCRRDPSLLQQQTSG